jgi:hypothetical protein
MKYFVLIYDQNSGHLGTVEEFPEGSGEAALQRRFELERENLDRPELEVVLLGAESREDLELTHARYFKSVEELAASV